MPWHSDNARERELYRYFQPDDTAIGINSEGRPIAKSSSSDFSLTAFAQLGALRLNAKRGIIFLASRTTEYIIAEAGRSLSLQDDSRHAPDDELWYGVGILRGKDGRINPRVAPLILNHLRDTAQSDNYYLIVNDMAKDDRFKDRPIVKEAPFARFSAFFPIITPANFVIGAYVIIDDKPREGLRDDEIHFLKDMASTVMDHLKSLRKQKQHHRAERMVKALGLFIEGKSSLRDWWINQEGHNIKLAKVKGELRQAALEQAADVEFGAQESTDNHWTKALEDISPPDPPSELTSASAILKNFQFGRPQVDRLSSTSSLTSIEPRTVDSTSDTGHNDWRKASESTGATTLDSGASTPHIIVDSTHDTATFDTTSGKRLQEALVSADMKSAFSRAANLIREAIGLDGAVFYDANVGSLGCPKQRNTAPMKVFGNDIADTTSSSDDDPGNKKGDGLGFSSKMSSLTTQPKADSLEESEKTCNVLAFSTRTRSSVNAHLPSDELRSLPEALLRRLLKKYPKGKVFNFDDSGCVSSTESDGNLSNERDSQPYSSNDRKGQPQRRRKRMSREMEATAVSNALPGVRSAVFFPLWDASKERWIAGSFIWSASPMRVLCPYEDVSYIAAFGNSITAELSRISAILAAQMKIDFTSSISHELRSPLHGVLASVEFLQETSMTEMQEDMVNTIHACGNTLLDTINHVLDFSKVNRRLKEEKILKKKHNHPTRDISRTRRMSKANTNEDTEDISVLTEEVVDSVYAGYRVSKRLSTSPGPQRPTSTTRTLSSNSVHLTHPVIVITDIKWRENWNFKVDGGAWRRILMNIFGNSMKYTETGFVHVYVTIDDNSVSQSGIPQPRLLLTVSDSGKGISEDFLKNHLYTPFTQEDALAPGTGLGLSIVHQIIRGLDGTIDFISEQGTGTEARITLPLKESDPTDENEEKNSIILEVREKTKGLKALLVAFDTYPDIVDTPTGILSAEAQATISLKSSIGSTLQGWFGMELLHPSTSEADVHVILESGINESESLENKIRAIAVNRSEPSAVVTVLVLCTTFPSLYNPDTVEGVQVFYIPQPYGPRKLANVLHHAFCNPPGNSTAAPQLLPRATPQLSLTHSESVASKENNKKVTTKAPRVTTQSSKLEFANTGITNGTSKVMNVLLVEDNEINLKLLVAYMHKLHLPHATASNGLEALHTYQAGRGSFDIIFMDISMPIMDGLTASRKIRDYEKEENIRSTTIIALTGAASMSTKHEAFRSGIDLFLTKPVPMKKLRAILEDLRDGNI